MTFRNIFALILICCFGLSLAGQDDCPGFEVPNFYIDNQLVANGQTVCVDLMVEDFVNVESFQFAMSFDPTIVSYVDNSFFDYAKLSQSMLVNVSQAQDSGIVYLVYEAFGMQDNLADDCAIAQLCFDVIGDPCTCATFNVINANNLTSIEIVHGMSCTYEYEAFTLGEICVVPDDVSANLGLCHGQNNDASITFTICGGSPNYDWTLNGPITSTSGTVGANIEEMVNGLEPGAYTLSITDSNGTPYIENFVIEDKPPLSIAVEQFIEPACASLSNGILQVQGVGGTNILGTEGYSYNWSNGQFTRYVEQLGNGSYTVTVEDASGCTATETFVFDVPELELNYMVIPDTCSGEVGRIDFEITGGTPEADGSYDLTVFQVPFTGPISGSQSFTELAASTYVFDITDASLCKLIVEVEVEDVVPALFSLTDVEDVSCFGECDGSFFMDIQYNGNFAFSVTDAMTGQPAQNVIPNASNGTVNATDLCGGSYQVVAIETGTDCRFDTLITIIEPTELDLILDKVCDATSCSSPNGQIFIRGIGGTPSYDYTWDPDVTNSNTVLNAEPGTYRITVTDEAMCTDTITVEVGIMNAAEVQISVESPIGCNGSTQGMLSAAPVGDSPLNYTYAWYNTTNGSLIGVGPNVDVNEGTFHVIMTGGISECVDSDTITMTSVNDLSFDLTFTDPSCFNSNDGIIEIFDIQGGAQPYSGIWADFSSTDTIITTAGEGFFAVTVTDFFGCTRDTFVTLTAPDPITFDVDEESTDCFDSMDGTFTVNASGGNAPNGYTFDWSDNIPDEFNVTQSQAMNLGIGDYTVTVYDEDNCSIEVAFDIEGPEPLTIDDAASIEIKPNCPEDCSGILQIEILGGTPEATEPEYSFLWEDASNDLVRENLCPGVYELTVEDANGCTNNFVFDFSVITNPVILEIDSTLSKSVNCNDAEMSSGQIAVIGSGGSGDPSDWFYEWDPPVSVNVFANNLEAGFYEITVTDNNGCTASTFYEITPAATMDVVIPTPDPAPCAGGTTCLSIESVSGGSGSPYFYSVGNQNNLPIDSCLTLFAGTYDVTVFDSLGCPFDTIIQIAEPTITEVDLGDNIEVQLGENSVVVLADYIGDNPIDSVTWSLVDSFECLDILCQEITIDVTQDQLLSVIVTDENGCTARDEIQISVDDQRNVFVPTILIGGDLENGRVMLFPDRGATMINYFNIYDRWGNLVYSVTDIPAEDAALYGWEGEYNGTPAETGVYVYIAEVTYLDGESRIFSKDITLLR